jgi:hypothetical protein
MKKLKNILFVILFSLAMVSCQESKPETDFSDDGVSFTVPEGWEVSGQEIFDNSVHYLVIEKGGLSSSGILTMSWADDSLDLMEWLDLYESAMMEETVYKGSDIKFVGPVVMNYNEFTTVSKSFTVTILTLKHQGFIHIFHANGKTFSILKQEAIEDNNVNKPGFDLIEKTLRVSSN